MALQLRTLNNHFAIRGIQERLVKGKGYYYFAGGDAEKWRNASVNVYKLNQLGIKGWFDVWSELSGKPSPFKLHRPEWMTEETFEKIK